MGRSPRCEKVGLKKRPWTPQEDKKLLAYIEEHGNGSWRALSLKAGLERCGKSCRLRWTNYLRPDIKRGKFSLQEEQTIIQLHAFLGNRWSAIATHLPKRTDNEIKNYWNTHLKKRLTKMGIDPLTHKPKSDALSSIDGLINNTANLSHLVQWESARLEAEARLVRESKLRSSACFRTQLPASSTSSFAKPPLCDVLNAWSGVWPKLTKGIGMLGRHLESPTSTLSSSENTTTLPILTVGHQVENETAIITTEFCGNSAIFAREEMKVEREDDWKSFEKPTWSSNFKVRIENLIDFQEMVFNGPDGGYEAVSNFVGGFTGLLSDKNDEERFSSDGVDSEEENDNYWNNILNVVHTSPSNSDVF